MDILSFLNSPLGLAVIAGAAAIFLPKLGIKLPWSPVAPVDPTKPTPAPAPVPTDMKSLIEAIIRAVLEQMMPQVQAIVREEVANRPPSNGGSGGPVSVEAKADGSTVIAAGGLSVTTSPKQ